MSKTILVTGGEGFIGANLVKRLKEIGHNVITMDFKSEDYACDISDYNNFKYITEDIDVIYHLAGQSYGRGGLIEPHKDLDWNTKGTLNVCLFAKDRNIKKIIYTSTMAVYGNADYSKEDDIPNPLSNYGCSKLNGENYLKQFSQNYDIDYTIFRLFNTYGPGQDIKHVMKGVVSVFLSQVIKGNLIESTGTLDRYRDLTYIDDCVDALVLGMNPKLKNNTYNVSNNKKTTMKELIEQIIEVSDKNIESFTIKNIGSHDGDQFGNTGDNSKLKSVGWKPKFSLKEGLKIFYKYAKEKII
jgi:UDP-glucose 4-epimerase